jgi:hypothetical protein
MRLDSGGIFSIGGNTAWHAGNDGAGSGLDADTLDGVQGSAYAALAGTQTFTGRKTFFVSDANSIATSSSSLGPIEVNQAGAGAAFIAFHRTGAHAAYFGLDTDNVFKVGGWSEGANAYPVIIGGKNNSTTLQVRTAASTETTGTLTVASANKTIQATGDITIPNAVFAAGDIILIYAGASSRTITEGSSVTMRLGGSSTTGSRTLAARGVAVLFFVSSSEVVVSGGAVT